MKFFSKIRIELLSIGWPITIQSLLTTSMLLIDSIMVAPLGDLSISSMGASGAIIIIIFSIQLGVANGTLMLMSQAFGRGRKNELKRNIYFGLVTNLSISIVLFGLIEIFHLEIIGLLTNSLEMSDEIWRYLSVTKFVIPITAITLILSFSFRSMGNTIIPLKGFMIEVPLNIVFNTVLIYGVGDFIGFGLEGAAIASVLARIFRLLFLVCKFKLMNKLILSQPFKINRIQLGKFKSYLKIISPYVLTSIGLTIGGTFYHLIFIRMPIEDYTAYTLMIPWLGIGITVANSFASASTIQISRILGTGNFDNAEDAATTCISTTVMVCIMLALVLILSRPVVTVIYSGVSFDVKSTLSILFPMSSLLIILKSYNLTVANGILRSGADSLFTLSLDVLSQWLIALPLCALVGLILKMPVHWVFGIMILEESIKLIPLYARLKQRMWLRIVTV